VYFSSRFEDVSHAISVPFPFIVLLFPVFFGPSCLLVYTFVLSCSVWIFGCSSVCRNGHWTLMSS